MGEDMNIAIITGASSGLGMEFALQMDPYFRNIDEFWLIARRAEKLALLGERLSHKTRIFAVDITDSEKLEELENQVKQERGIVRMLLNCAGYGIMGDFASSDRDASLGMIDLNCRALTSLTHRLLPYMRQNSRIIQIASSAAFLPQPDFAVYAATKAYVLNFSLALGSELSSKGIYVTSVCPGPVNTPFLDIAEKDGHTLKLKKYFMADAETVVRQALRDSFLKKKMSVYGCPIKGLQIASKLLPYSFFLDGMRLLKNLEQHFPVTICAASRRRQNGD